MKQILLTRSIVSNMNEPLYSWPLTFHKVVRQQIWGEVIVLNPHSSADSFWIQQWKKYENRSIFADALPFGARGSGNPLWYKSFHFVMAFHLKFDVSVSNATSIPGDYGSLGNIPCRRGVFWILSIFPGHWSKICPPLSYSRSDKRCYKRVKAALSKLVTLTFDLLTLKVVSESHVTWATSVPILVFLGLSVLDLGPMYTTDVRQTTSDVRQKHCLMPPPIRGRVIIMVLRHGFMLTYDNEQNTRLCRSADILVTQCINTCDPATSIYHPWSLPGYRSPRWQHVCH